MIIVVAIFTLGNGISGGANDPATLIAGRAIQSVGGGGSSLCIEHTISDLILMRERSAYMGIVFAFFTLGTAISAIRQWCLCAKHSLAIGESRDLFRAKCTDVDVKGEV